MRKLHPPQLTLYPDPVNQHEHVSRGPFKAVGDVLVLAGDTLPLKEVDAYKAHRFFDWCSANYRETFLIPGNHDMKNIRPGFMKRFEYVTQQMTIRVGGQSIILNHNPFLCYGGAYRDVWQLFGHVHSGPLSKTGLDHPRLNMLFPLQYDVGVDNNFRPVSFAEVRRIIMAQNTKQER